MGIFESLENLNVSEECFDDIMDIVEAQLSEAEDNYEAAQDRHDRNKWKIYDKTSCVYYDCKGGKRGAQKEAKRLNTAIPTKPQIDLTYEGIIDIVGALLSEEHNTLYTGHPVKDENKYVVTSKHDDGELKTTTYADSAKKAEELVNNVEGGPPRAHKVLVKDNPERTAEAVKKVMG